jgi:glycosyltransferase involved in cell wall biosynthesis
MLVSVIIPTRDRADLVMRAVASVLAQTHGALDLVVVDDGSVDDTRARLAGLADPRLRVLAHGAPRGVSAARNTGLAAARGDYFALLDSDDEWLPPKVERLLAFARKHGYGICQNQEIWLRGGRRVNPGKAQEKIDGFFFEQALVRCLVSPSSVLFTREFSETVGGFDESLPACEDYDLWLRALVRHPVGLLHEWLTVRHGGRADQLSAAFVGLDLFRIRSMLGLLGRGDLSDWHRDCIKKELRRKTDVYARGCLKNDRPEEARRVLDLVAGALAGPASGGDFPLGDGLGLDPGERVGQGGDDVFADVAGGHDEKQVVAGLEGAGPGRNQHPEHARHGLALPADGLHQALVHPDLQGGHRGA